MIFARVQSGLPMLIFIVKRAIEAFRVFAADFVKTASEDPCILADPFVRFCEKEVLNDSVVGRRENELICCFTI